MGNRKHKKKRKSKSKSKAIDLTLRLNVELQQGPSKARVKRIGSRKRPNLRTMRNGMGGLTPANLKQPSFFGNTNLLTNAAMADEDKHFFNRKDKSKCNWMPKHDEIALMLKSLLEVKGAEKRLKLKERFVAAIEEGFHSDQKYNK